MAVKKSETAEKKEKQVIDIEHRMFKFYVCTECGQRVLMREDDDKCPNCGCEKSLMALDQKQIRLSSDGKKVYNYMTPEKPVKYTIEELAKMSGYDEKKYEEYLHTKAVLRNAVAIYYDLQKQRIAAGNRIVQMLNTQLGQRPSKKQDDEMDKEVVKMLDILRKEEVLIADAYSEFYSRSTKAADGDKVEWKEDTKFYRWIKANIESLDVHYLKTDADYRMIRVYENLRDEEEVIEQVIADKLEGIPVYEQYLKNVKGCGTLMSAVIIAYLDIYKAKYAGSFWKYAGIDCVYDPEKDEWVGRTKQYVEEQWYENKKHEMELKTGLTYNPTLKSKLLGVLAGSFLKLQSDWAVCFYDKRNYYRNNPKYADYNDVHILAMCKRYMIKMFLLDLFEKWKAIEGLPVPTRYTDEKLDMMPHHWDPFDEWMDKHPEDWSSKMQDNFKETGNWRYNKKKLESMESKRKKAKHIAAAMS